MEPTAVVLYAVLFLAAWYLLASFLARFVNRRAVSKCPCEVVRYLGDPSSLYVDLNCGGKKVEVYMRREPWDNPLNLAAFYLLRRRAYTAVRFSLGFDAGVMDASRRGAGRRVGNYYVVNTSTPRELAERLLSLADEAGVWRVTVSGEVVQLLWRGKDCSYVEKALSIIKNIAKER